MDKKLKEAIVKDKAEKAAKEQAERAGLLAEAKARQDAFEAALPKARKWIKEVLFPKIAEIEAKGTNYRQYVLGRYEDGIPAEVIYEAAKKIKGLRPITKTYPIYSGQNTRVKVIRAISSNGIQKKTIKDNLR